MPIDVTICPTIDHQKLELIKILIHAPSIVKIDPKIILFFGVQQKKSEDFIKFQKANMIMFTPSFKDLLRR